MSQVSWKSVPLASLQVGLQWGRIPERLIEQMMMSMMVQGMVPINVRELPRTGWFWFLRRKRYLILDGKIRAEAAARLGFKTIPAKVFTDAFDRIVTLAKPVAHHRRHAT